jgi:hypothetical protein
VAADDLFFNHCLAPPAAEYAERVAAEIGAGVEEEEQEEEAANGAEDDAYDDARLWAGIEPFIRGRDSKDLGLPFREEYGGGRYVA